MMRNYPILPSEIVLDLGTVTGKIINPLNQLQLKLLPEFIKGDICLVIEV